LSKTASYVDYTNVKNISTTSTFVGTASYATQALTASYVAGMASTSSWSVNSQTASYVDYGNVKNITNTSTFAGTASYVASSSYADLSQTASYIALAQSASYVTLAQTASYVLLSQTASYVLQAVSASFSTTASYATVASAIVSSANVNINQLTASAIQVTNLNVVTITSSIDYASGSNIFGTKSTDTQRFTGSVSITGSLSINGPITMAGVISAIVIKTTNYTVTAQDNLIVCNHATTPFTVTLLDASTATGREFTLKNKGAAEVTIDATGLGLLDGDNTYSLTQYQSIKVISDGTTWNVI
jgi:hypothetical protein